MTDEPVKVRVMLWLEEKDAIKLRTLAAAAGCRGVSEYIADFVLAPKSVSMVEEKCLCHTTTSLDGTVIDCPQHGKGVVVRGLPTYVEDHEDGTD